MRNEGMPESNPEPAAQAAAPAKENFDTLLRVDPISIEVGIGLAYLAAGGAELAACCRRSPRSAAISPRRWDSCFRRCGSLTMWPCEPANT